jgi:sulfite exporter TauE/SafE
MCGPIALALPVAGSSHESRFTATLLYNLGRIVTYSFLGVIAGLAGSSLLFLGIGRWLSVLIGILIILFIAIPKNKIPQHNFLAIGMMKLRQTLSKLLSQQKRKQTFYIGLLNGLLPCGLIYIALAGAVSTASVLHSSLFMATFGLGTLPFMWALSFFGMHINMNFRMGIKKIYPYLLFGMAVLLILRGLGLGIPMISPGTHPQSGITIGCHD